MWSSLTGTQHVHRDYSRSSGFLGQKHGAHASWGHIASPEQRAGVRASLGRIQSRSSVQVGGPPSHHPHPHSVQEPGTPAGRIQWVALVVNQAAGKIKKTDADESLHVCLTDSGTPHQHIFFFWEYSDDYIQLTCFIVSTASARRNSRKTLKEMKQQRSSAMDRLSRYIHYTGAFIEDFTAT